MQYRCLGRSGLRVSELGLGCSRLGGGLLHRDDRAAGRIIGRALEHGINFFDTADVYAYGHVERLLGRHLRGRRDRVVLASKGGHLPTSLGRFAKPLRPARRILAPLVRPFYGALKRASRGRGDYSAAHLGGALEGSLRRLNTDYLDLYQLHNPPRELLESGEMIAALERFKQQGKIRFVGVSVRDVDDGLLCLRHPGVDAIQVAFNLLQPEAAERLLPRAGAQGVGIVARVPLARGALVANARGGTERVLAARRAALAELLVDDQRTLAQAALRFVLAHREVSTVIAGTARLEHLDHNAAALGARDLTAAELDRVRQLARS